MARYIYENEDFRPAKKGWRAVYTWYPDDPHEDPAQEVLTIVGWLIQIPVDYGKDLIYSRDQDDTPRAERNKLIVAAVMEYGARGPSDVREIESDNFKFETVVAPDEPLPEFNLAYHKSRNPAAKKNTAGTIT